MPLLHHYVNQRCPYSVTRWGHGKSCLLPRINGKNPWSIHRSIYLHPKWVTHHMPHPCMDSNLSIDRTFLCLYSTWRILYFWLHWHHSSNPNTASLRGLDMPTFLLTLIWGRLNPSLSLFSAPNKTGTAHKTGISLTVSFAWTRARRRRRQWILSWWISWRGCLNHLQQLLWFWWQCFSPTFRIWSWRERCSIPSLVRFFSYLSLGLCSSSSSPRRTSSGLWPLTYLWWVPHPLVSLYV